MHVRFTKIFPPLTKRCWISHTTTTIVFSFHNNSHSYSNINGTTITTIQLPLISQIILLLRSYSIVNSLTNTTHGSSCLWTGELTQAPEVKGNKMREYISYLQPTRKPSRSQYLRGQRRGSAATRLLGLWVRIPPGAWMSLVSVLRCQVVVSTSGWSFVQRVLPSVVVLRVIINPRQRGGLGPLGLLRHGTKEA